MGENKQIMYSFIDEEDVLTRLSGNISLFNKLFAQFIVGFRFSSADIHQLIHDKDYDNARILAHKIKGTAANLGIKSLSQTASDLESSIISGDPKRIEGDLEQFSNEMEAIVMEVSES